MDEHEDILSIYGSICERSGAMLKAARSNDWDRVLVLEQEYQALIAFLQHGDRNAISPPNVTRRKIGYIRQLLADDAEIRRLAEPWMAQLELHLGRARREKQLQLAYDSGHAC